MKNRKSNFWADYTAGEFYDAILKGDEDSASIAYYLVDKQLKKRLKIVFEGIGCNRFLDFQDSIEDFFLYLHDGTSWMYKKPFYILESIENKDSLFKWMTVTYRNFMLKKLNEEMRTKSACEHIDNVQFETQDEDKIKYLSTAIAYADQQNMSRNRFVMYRLLLTFLNRSLAIPQEDMAQAVDMHPVAYRVSTKRVKDNIRYYLKCLQQGEKLDLDLEHRQMRDVIMTNFDSLYSILSVYYDKAINQLPNSEAVKRLRFGYNYNENYVFHEDIASYGPCNCTNVNVLCGMLLDFLGC